METEACRLYEPFLTEIPAGEEPFDASPLREVTESKDGTGWSVTTESSWGTFLPRLTDDQPPPEVGQLFEVFGQLGFEIQGQRLAGRVIFWRDSEQREAKRRRWLEDYAAQRRRRFVRDRDRLDRDYAALPSLLKNRIDRVRL
jgi:hypothetical protein